MPPSPTPPARPVVEPLGASLEPWQAVALVRGDEHPFVLTGDWAGGSRVVAGSAPVEVLAAGEDPFAALDRQPRVETADDMPAGTVGGGWVGWLGFGLGEALEPVGGPPPRPVALPHAVLRRHDHVVRCDAAGTWWLEALVVPGREAAIAERFALLRARALAVGAPRPWRTGAWRSVPALAGHAAAVEACVERIAHGDLFQANLALRLEAPFEGDPADLHAAGVRALAPAKAAWLAGPWGAVASLSPEGFLRRAGDVVASSPIKGTRPATDAGRAALLAAEKDRAEHVMIVDLVRNDLGRIAEPGSVRVAALAEPREGPGVWHLVSDVEARVRAGIGDGELVRACFPPGSVTGAPKVAALRTIAELESTGREAYCGAIGIASPLAGLDLNVAIRTFEARDGGLWLGVGGGVVADSTGAGEAEEVTTKARALLALAGGASPWKSPADAPAAPRPRRRGPVPLPRPDPRAGVFETLRVEGGVPLHLERHLRRLEASVRALGGRGLEGDLALRIATAAARAPDPGRLRVDLAPGGRAHVATSAIPPGPAVDGTGLVLVPVVVPGGVGAHKWADRAIWDLLEADVGTGAVPLVVDLDGAVLEAPRASLLLDAPDGTLRAPPLDGRILPGTTRARALAEARAAGRAVDDTTPVTLEELAEAPAAWLAGALRGLQRATLASHRLGPGILSADG